MEVIVGAVMGGVDVKLKAPAGTLQRQELNLVGHVVGLAGLRNQF